jgi:two-component system nitrate/nitrite response regulator NarL
MRVLLVGSPAERARLRARLAGQSTEIAGEFSTLATARSSHVDADAIVVAPGRREDRTLEEPMTTREIEVLELLTEGLPNKAIAARLGISDQTVKFHVSSICGKLGAANRTDAVRRAIRRGLVAI